MRGGVRVVNRLVGIRDIKPLTGLPVAENPVGRHIYRIGLIYNYPGEVAASVKTVVLDICYSSRNKDALETGAMLKTE